MITGSTPGTSTAPTRELWCLPPHGNDQQKPLTQHRVSVHVVAAGVHHLSRAQCGRIHRSDRRLRAETTLRQRLPVEPVDGLRLSAEKPQGSARTERGSLPQHVSSIFQLTLYA